MIAIFSLSYSSSSNFARNNQNNGSAASTLHLIINQVNELDDIPALNIRLFSAEDERIATTKQCTLPASTIPNFVKSITITHFSKSFFKLATNKEKCRKNYIQISSLIPCLCSFASFKKDCNGIFSATISLSRFFCSALGFEISFKRSSSFSKSFNLIILIEQ